MDFVSHTNHARSLLPGLGVEKDTLSVARLTQQRVALTTPTIGAGAEGIHSFDSPLLCIQ